MRYEFKKNTIITGYYGCGKTNLAVNIALILSKMGSVCIVDLDIVNPYFRAADFDDLFKANKIDLVCPQFAGSNLDVPSFCFDLAGLADKYDYLIVDVGGDDSGAYALGKFSSFFNKCEDFDMLYVFNMYRGMSADNVVETMHNIESASRLKCTAVVNSSNLGELTTSDMVMRSVEYAQEVKVKSGLPLAFTCVTEDFVDNINSDVLKVKRLVKMPWEE